MLDSLEFTKAEQADEQGLVISSDTLARFGNGDRRQARKWIRTWLFKMFRATPINGPTEKPPTVRVAVPADEPALLRLMLLDVEENASGIAAPSPEKILEHIQQGTQRKGAILGVIDGPDGTPVACINLTMFQWWWSRAFFLQEVWNFVHPAYRATKHADSLMKFAKWASDNMTREFGYRVWLLQGVTTKDNVQAKIAFYSRHTNFIGAFFLYPHPGG